MEITDLHTRDSLALETLRQETVAEVQKTAALQERFTAMNSSLDIVHKEFETIVSVLRSGNGYKFEVVIDTTEDDVLGRIDYVAHVYETKSYNFYMSQRRDFYTFEAPTCYVEYARRIRTSNQPSVIIAKEEFAPTLASRSKYSIESLEEDEMTIEKIVNDANQTLKLLWSSALDPNLNPKLAEKASEFLQQCAAAIQTEQ